jgi:Tfp pilus assembly protein PilX
MIVRPKSRRGSALLMSVVVLAFLLMVLMVLLKLCLAERRQARFEENRMRASWLAESGLERAWAKLAVSSDYRGESWEIPAESLRSHDPALVKIQVDPVAGDTNRVRVTSRADYPREGPSRARQTRISSLPKTKISSSGADK